MTLAATGSTRSWRAPSWGCSSDSPWRAVGRSRPGGTPSSRLASAAEPLPEIDDPASRAFDRYGQARVVLLGEASHGPANITAPGRRSLGGLIETHGFDIVAVEADWRTPPPSTASCATSRTADDHAAVQPFPTWMLAQHRRRGLYPLAAPAQFGAARRPQGRLYGLDSTTCAPRWRRCWRPRQGARSGGRSQRIAQPGLVASWTAAARL